MRILLKIVLFPVTLALSLLVLVLRAVHGLSGMVMYIISGLLFLLAAAIAVFSWMGNPMFKDSWDECVIALVFAVLLSPYGLPFLAAVLIERLDGFNRMIKGI